MDSIRVLLVDENLAFLRVITLFLEQQDDITVVGTSSNGPEGLAQAQSLRPQVVLIDLGTPGLTGIETISNLRTAMSDVGIVVMSLLGANGYREKALSAGADEVIVKARLSTELIPSIRRVARKARPSDM
jgi:DNA-binding NarL/FixJ family response regulator